MTHCTSKAVRVNRIMANRACATLKALTVLGNTIRGLSMANWRLTFNAVCLPVLSYECKLWLRTGFKGQKKLVDLLQKVQNEGVRMVTVPSGQLCTLRSCTSRRCSR